MLLSLPVHAWVWCGLAASWRSQVVMYQQPEYMNAVLNLDVENVSSLYFELILGSNWKASNIHYRTVSFQVHLTLHWSLVLLFSHISVIE